MSGPTPPPSYSASLRDDLTKKSSYGAHEDSVYQAGEVIIGGPWKFAAAASLILGPNWLYHFPQQSQFNSPYTSLQYEDLGNRQKWFQSFFGGSGSFATSLF